MPTPTGAAMVKPSLMSKSFADERCKLWNSLLAAQVSTFAKAEQRYLSELPWWRDAGSVADIGCGNGDYLAQLNHCFPGKTYVGVDTSAELISIAQRKHEHLNVRFSCGDITQSVPFPKVDGIILRFVVQHLEDPQSFFRALRRLLHPTGFVLIIEPNLKASHADPDLVKFQHLVRAYESLAQSVGAARAQIQDSNRLQQLVGNGWTVASVDPISSKHDRDGWDGKALYRVFAGWIDAIQATNKLEWDYASVKSEVAEWLESTGHRIDFVLSATMLMPKS